MDEEGSISTTLVKSIWTDKEFNNDYGRKSIKSLFGISIMDFPKSPELLKRLLDIGSSPDSIIMDFFSGSSTTAHAVMQLNAEDGGNRRFIMVQLPEVCDEKSEAFKAGYKTIAEIGKERIRRAGKKIKDDLIRKNDARAEHSPVDQTELELESRDPASVHNSSFNLHPSSLDIGFRVLKVDTSNVKDIYYQPDQVKQDELSFAVDPIKEDRSAEDLLFQVMLDWGVDLALPISKVEVRIMNDEGGGSRTFNVFFVDDNAIAACFETEITEDFVKELAKRQPLRAVFRDNGFASDAVKINVQQIFRMLSPATEVKTL